MRVSKKDFHIKSVLPIILALLVLTSNAVAASGPEVLRKLAFDEAAHRSAALQATAREDNLVATHIRFIRQHFGCQDSDIEVLSMPVIQDGVVGVNELRRGRINFIYHVRTADAVVRVHFSPSYGHAEQLHVLRQRLFQGEPNPNSPIVPISEFGAVYLTVQEELEVERLYVIMPFVRGELLPSYLAAHPQQVFPILKEVLRTPFEFHRHAVLVKDYKDENFKVDVSDERCPVKLFDYADDVACLQEDDLDMVMARTEIENLVIDIAEILRPFGVLIEDADRAEIKARLSEVTRPLGQSNRQEVERVYNERIFPLLDDLIAKYSTAPINADTFAHEAIRNDPFISQHIKRLAAKFNVAESGVTVLSVPAVAEELGGIHGGSANYVYHIPERDVVARILNLHLAGGHLEKIGALQTRLFPDGPNNDTRVVPIWEFGEMTFERNHGTATLPYVLMPFMRGEPLLPYLAENPQRRLWALLDVMRNVYEFHRRGVLTVDYKPEHFKVDTSNTRFHIRLFDYVESSAVLDPNDAVQRTMVPHWVRYNLENIEDLIVSVLEPISGVVDDQDLQAIRPLLAQLRQPLLHDDRQEVERIYWQEIFPFFERLMEKYESALATAQPVTDIGTDQARISLEGVLRPEAFADSNREFNITRLENTAGELLGPAHMQARINAVRRLQELVARPAESLVRVEADGHTHSLHSDGYQTPTALVWEAYKLGLKSITLTDHNTLAGTVEAIEAGKVLGIDVISGVEFAIGDGQYRGVEIIVQFPDSDSFLNWYQSDSANFIKLITRRLTDGQETQTKQLLRNVLADLRFQKALEGKTFDYILGEVAKASRGYPLTPGVLGEVLWAVGGTSLGDTIGIDIESGGNAYDFILKDSAIWVDSEESLLPEEAIALADPTRNGGMPGLSFLCHPKTIKLGEQPLTEAQLDEFVARYKGLGMDGIQADDRRNQDQDTDFYLFLAEKHNLLIIIGSDYHGSGRVPYLNTSVSRLGRGNVGLDRVRLPEAQLAPTEGNLRTELGRYAAVERIREVSRQKHVRAISANPAVQTLYSAVDQRNLSETEALISQIRTANDNTEGVVVICGPLAQQTARQADSGDVISGFVGEVSKTLEHCGVTDPMDSFAVNWMVEEFARNIVKHARKSLADGPDDIFGAGVVRITPGENTIQVECMFQDNGVGSNLHELLARIRSSVDDDIAEDTGRGIQSSVAFVLQKFQGGKAHLISQGERLTFTGLEGVGKPMSVFMQDPSIANGLRVQISFQINKQAPPPAAVPMVTAVDDAQQNAIAESI